MSIVASIISDLADCICEAFTEANEAAGGEGTGLCYCGPIPGGGLVESYAWPEGDGGCGGAAWVRLIQIYPAVGVGRPATDYDGCGTLVGFDLEVGSVRTIGIDAGDGTLNPAPEEDMIAAALEGADEAMLLRKAIKCCSALGSKDYRLGTYIPTGPFGGLVGGAWNVQVAL